jgi:arsenate reductase-like glutaredoxin family protein
MEPHSISLSYIKDITDSVNEAITHAMAKERERCIKVVQDLADASEDQIIKEILEDAVIIMRRAPIERN